MPDRDEKNFDEYSPEVSFDDSWREYRRLVLKTLEDLHERQEKQEISIHEIKEILTTITIDNKSIKQQHYYYSLALGFFVSVVGYAIQYFFFKK